MTSGPPTPGRTGARGPGPSFGAPRASSSLLALLPPGITAQEVDLATADLPSGARRRREFLAGRAAATAALRGLGLEGPVGRDTDRRPVWPTGAVGSIAHCRHLAVAITAPVFAIRALGVDVEEVADVTGDLWDVVLTPAEQQSLAGCGERLPLSVSFSAKESAFKCWSPLLDIRLEWTDIEVALDQAAGGFTAVVVRTSEREVPPPVQGAYAVRDAHVLSAAWVARD